MRTFLLSFTVLMGCGPDLPQPSKVDSLRVIAMRAEPPEAAPGDTVVLDALVVDWHGQGEVALPGGVVARRAYGRLCLIQGDGAETGVPSGA